MGVPNFLGCQISCDTGKYVCTYKKVCAYKKGAPNNPSLRYCVTKAFIRAHTPRALHLASLLRCIIPEEVGQGHKVAN